MEGPIPNSDSKHKYLFTATDEFSQFCWGFALPNRSDESVTRSLSTIILFSGAPKFVHESSDSGIITSSVKNFLRAYGVSTSRINPPTEAIDCTNEHFYGIVWRTVKLFMEDWRD